ncbi:protein phosphatase 2C domain-containing protein [Polymorphospora sp. NPDC051019]|uniref:protein phosphatase 2C domain-containing protein n=1 Tax=Polymorphospora sp. NPDC051019 TaxID=3155725 RepID=UPI00343895B0
MEVTALSRAAPGGDNEDAVVTGDTFAVALDGATAEPGFGSGCRHGVRWFARSIAGELGRLLGTDPDGVPLPVLLRDAAGTVRAAHADTCDLDDPRSPSATVAMLRLRGDRIEHLVLGDAVLLLRDRRGRVTVVSDDRIRRFYHLPWSRLHDRRNVPGGFWVVGARPDAAAEALTGSVPVAELDCAAVLTDGAARLVERFGWTWDDLLAVLRRDGPAALVAATRAAERAAPPADPDDKAYDDATVALCHFHD